MLKLTKEELIQLLEEKNDLLKSLQTPPKSSSNPRKDVLSANKLKGGVFEGSADTRPLADLKNFIDQTIRINDWNVRHHYFLLVANIQPELFSRLLPQEISPLEKDEDFDMRVKSIWTNLSAICVGTLSMKKHLVAAEGLIQNKTESEECFVKRVRRWGADAQFYGLSRSDDEVKLLMQRGLRNRSLAKDSNAFLKLDLNEFCQRICLEATSYRDEDLVAALHNVQTTAVQKRQLKDFKKSDCSRCYQDGHTAADCSAKTPSNCDKRCKRCSTTRHTDVALCSQPADIRCKRCGGTGHVASICLSPTPVAVASLPNGISGLLRLTLTVSGSIADIEVCSDNVLLDSGASRSFLKTTIAKQLWNHLGRALPFKTADDRRQMSTGNVNGLVLTFADGQQIRLNCVLVVDNLAFDMILALDDLTEVGYRLEGSKNKSKLSLGKS